MIRRFLFVNVFLWVFAFLSTWNAQAALFAASLADGEGVQYAGIVFLGNSGGGSHAATASVCEPSEYPKFCKEPGQIGVGEACEGRYKSCACEEKYTHCECWPDHRANTCTVDGYTYFDKCKPCTTCSAKIYPYTHENCTVNGELAGDYCTDAAGLMHYKECKCKPEYKICPCGESPRAKKCERDIVAKWSQCQECNKCPFEKFPFTADNCLSPKVLSGACTENDGSLHYSSCDCEAQFSQECPCGGAVGATSCTTDGVMKWTACKSCEQDCTGYTYNANNCLSPAVLGGETCTDKNGTNWTSCTCPGEYGAVCTAAYGLEGVGGTCDNLYQSCQCMAKYVDCECGPDAGASACTSGGVTKYDKCKSCIQCEETLYPYSSGNCGGSKTLTGASCAENGLIRYADCQCKSSYQLCECGADTGATSCADSDGMKYDKCKTCASTCNSTDYPYTSSNCTNPKMAGGASCVDNGTTRYANCRCESEYTDCGACGADAGASSCTDDMGTKYDECKTCASDCSGYPYSINNCLSPAMLGGDSCAADGMSYRKTCTCPSSYSESCQGNGRLPNSTPCTVDGTSRYTACKCPDGWSDQCECGGAAGASVCYLGSQAYYSSCKDCTNTPMNTVVTALSIVYTNGDVLPYLDLDRKSEVWGIETGGIGVKLKNETGGNNNERFSWIVAYDRVQSIEVAGKQAIMPSPADFAAMYAERGNFTSTVNTLNSNGVSASDWSTGNEDWYQTSEEIRYTSCWERWENYSDENGALDMSNCKYCGPDWAYRCGMKRFLMSTGATANCYKFTNGSNNLWLLRVAVNI